jgi:hypothetical protein
MAYVVRGAGGISTFGSIYVHNGSTDAVGSVDFTPKTMQLVVERLSES